MRRSILHFLCRHALPLQKFVYVPVDNKHCASYGFAFVKDQAEQFRRCSFQFARTRRLDLAGSEGFERHESRYTKFQLDPVVFHVWSQSERVGFRLTSIFGLRYWPFVLGVHGWLQMVVNDIIVPEVDIFASSSGELNIIILDNMKKLKNVLSLETLDTLATFQLAGSSFNWIPLSSTFGHGVSVLASGRLPLVSHAPPRHRAQRVNQHYLCQASLVLRCFLPFQTGCAAGLCLTGLWSVRGWTLMCCSEARWFCHCGASGSEGHREVLVWVQNRRQQGQIRMA